MIISKSKKFVFIHIYKTGGSSINKIFLPYARTVEKVSSLWPTKNIVRSINSHFKLFDQGNKWINGVHKHASAREIRDYIGVEKYNEFFTFSFVRNPFDFQVSLYHYIKKSKIHKNHEAVNKLNFRDFVIRRIQNNCPLQSDYLSDEKGSLIVDYIGKTEDLDNSVKEITSKLSIPYLNTPHINKSSHSDNIMSYYDSEIKEMIYNHFKRDFDHFNY